MTEQKRVVTEDMAKSAGQFDELSASVWQRGVREGHLRLTLEQLKGVRAFYSEPPLSRHFAATVAELDALIAEQESKLDVVMLTTESTCDHCGKPEAFSVLCSDCEMLVCNECGRVECACGS